MSEKIRWGLVGAGALLERWIKGAMQVEDAEIAAIASRTKETAQKQAARYNIPDAMTYDEIFERKDLDILYILAPHTAHKDLTVRALEAGFPVLVEKPASVNAAGWMEMVETAKKNKKFLMEAVWTRCFPLSLKLKETISSGVIGDIRNIQATFAFRVPDFYQGRLFDPELAGGALLDVGVYDLHFAQMIMGKQPARMTAYASMDTDSLHLKVDEQCAIISQYDDGALAVLNAAIRTDMPDTAWIYGTEGYIRVPGFWKPQKFEINCAGETKTIKMPVSQTVEGIEDEGYQYEIRHAQECLRKGLLESPLVPHAASFEVLQQCDCIRKQCGLKYPFE